MRAMLQEAPIQVYQPGVQLFDMKNAIACSDTLVLARMIGLPDICP
jgi:hypothetical protein